MSHGVNWAVLPLKSLGKDPSLPLPVSGSSEIPWFVSTSLQNLSCLHMAFSSSCKCPLCTSYKDIWHWI